MQTYKKASFGAAAFFIIVVTSPTAIAKLERRMSIEVDANSIRFAIADVDHITDKVYQHLDYGSLEARFYDDLVASENQFFSSCMLKKAQSLFQKLRTRQEHFRAIKVRAIATETFRQAHNAEQLVQKIRRTTGIDIRILSTEEEDRMDFFSALTAANDSETPIVWNIGKESFQLIISNPESGPFAHKGEFGSVNFMGYLREVVQNKSEKSPASLSPVSTKEISAGITFARYLARRTPLLIQKELTKDKIVQVTGIGPVFQESLAENIAINRRTLDKGRLKQYIEEHASSSRANDSNLSNAILVFGFMEELKINKLLISDHNSTVSMLEFPILWH